MLQDSFLVQSDGSPGDVQSKLVSRSDNSRLREVELLAKDLDDPENGGDHPWTIADGVASTLLLFNESSKPQWFNVQIAAGATVWAKGYQLQPNQTLAISINDLRRTGAKDDKGHAFPKDIWSGQVGWSVPWKDAGRGRLLQSNPETAMARNFSCGETLEVCDLAVQALNDEIAYTNTVDYGTMAPEECMNSCSGTPVAYSYLGYNYQWDSENSSIASVSGSSYNQSVNVYGASVGSTYMDALVSDAYCSAQAQPSPPAAVQPTITGTPDQGNESHDIWYFGSGITSQSSGATKFTYSITLTATGNGTPTWNVPAGSKEVTLTPNPGTDTADVTSSGTAWSSTDLDVSITVTMNGVTSFPYQITTHVPYTMMLPSNYNHQCDSSYGYDDTITYNVFDQLGNNLSAYTFDYNETFTTSWSNVNGSNWIGPTEEPGTQNAVIDYITGYGVNNTPAPIPMPGCSGNDTEAQYTTQEWRVGSTTKGAGILLQTDQLARYDDKGAHNNITSSHP